MTSNRHVQWLLWCAIALLALFSTGCSSTVKELPTFDGDLAYSWLIDQCDLGFRPTGSDANIQTGDMILKELRLQGWETTEYTFMYGGVAVRNILAWKGDGPALVVGAHYDTRRQADEEDPAVPVLGANDGASGTAVLLELSRVIRVPKDATNSVYLAFFDAEDNGRLDNWNWIVGSSYMAENWASFGLPEIESLVIVDMVGDTDQQIFMDRYSNPELNSELWSLAEQLGYSDRFIAEYKYPMIDDHTPFIPISTEASVIIDFDYPYWHTTRDTPDKTSAASLQSVGDVVLLWLNNRLNP